MKHAFLFPFWSYSYEVYRLFEKDMIFQYKLFLIINVLQIFKTIRHLYEIYFLQT